MSEDVAFPNFKNGYMYIIIGRIFIFKRYTYYLSWTKTYILIYLAVCVSGITFIMYAPSRKIAKPNI